MAVFNLSRAVFNYCVWPDLFWDYHEEQQILSVSPVSLSVFQTVQKRYFI